MEEHHKAFKEFAEKEETKYYAAGGSSKEKEETKDRCTENSCDKEATEIRMRGEERIPYCETHAAWWDEIMENCF